MSARWAVVGIDPSLTGTGVAVITDRTISTHLLPSKALGTTLANRRNRLRLVESEVLNLVPLHARLVVLETPAYDSRTGSQHDRSGLWWLIADALHARAAAVAEVTTGGRAKYATGKGNAGKDAVLAAVVRRYPQCEVNGNNEADALVLAAMAARAIGQPIDNPPQAHLAAMGAVRWPEGVELEVTR